MEKRQCEGCDIVKLTNKRKSDGKMLCRKCSKNQSLTMKLKELKNDK